MHYVIDFVCCAAFRQLERNKIGGFDGDDLPASVAVEMGVRVNGVVLADVAEQIFGD